MKNKPLSFAVPGLLLLSSHLIVNSQPSFIDRGWPLKAFEIHSDSLHFTTYKNKKAEEVFNGTKRTKLTINSLPSPELSSYGAYNCSFDFGPYYKSNYHNFLSAHIVSDSSIWVLGFDTYNEGSVTTTVATAYKDKNYVDFATTVREENGTPVLDKVFKYKINKDYLFNHFRIPFIVGIYEDKEFSFVSLNILKSQGANKPKMVFEGYKKSSFRVNQDGDMIQIVFKIDSLIKSDTILFNTVMYGWKAQDSDNIILKGEKNGVQYTFYVNNYSSDRDYLLLVEDKNKKTTAYRFLDFDSTE